MSKSANKKGNILQAVKFALFSASAGVIQVVSFTLLNEVLIPGLHIENEKLERILSSEYGVCYLVALLLSVLWNFTFNRKFTFKSANNIKISMLKVLGFYCVFTPVSVVLGELVSRNTTWEFAEYVILGVTMATNMVSEFLFCKYVVYNEKNEKKVTENATEKVSK